MNLDLITQHGLLPNTLESLTLSEAYKLIKGDPQSKIPFIVWLLENPDSPLAFPGKISLHSHDCLHLLLGRGFSLKDEAFIIGFTMGNDSGTKKAHLVIYWLLSMFAYPKVFRFSYHDLTDFQIGHNYGKSLPTKNINQINFYSLYSQKIAQIRENLGIKNPSQMAALSKQHLRSPLTFNQIPLHY